MREVIRCCGVHCHVMSCLCVCECVCVCACVHVCVCLCKTWSTGRMESTFGTHMAKQGDYAVRTAPWRCCVLE